MGSNSDRWWGVERLFRVLDALEHCCPFCSGSSDSKGNRGPRASSLVSSVVGLTLLYYSCCECHRHCESHGYSVFVTHSESCVLAGKTVETHTVGISFVHEHMP